MENQIYELPPRLLGTPEDKLKELEEYLRRLVMRLNEERRT